MIVHVKNFGKIESADIDLSNLTIFVGENNSGKTYLMQLIYGLLDYFNNSEEFFNEFMFKYNEESLMILLRLKLIMLNFTLISKQS